MQIFMRGVAFRDNEDDLKASLATILHRPPFPTTYKMNFHIQLFRRGTTPLGRGLLTFPNAALAQLFLRMYPRGLIISGRTVQFQPSTKEPDQALIQKVASSEWEDPIQLRRERQRITEDSAPIVISRASFGRFCPDGVFSAEVDIRGPETKIVCNIDLRQLQLLVPAPGSSSLDAITETLAASTSTAYSVHYNAPSIVAIAISSTPAIARVFVEVDHPPAFVRQSKAIFDDSPPVSQRLTSLYGHEEMPPVTRALCVTFRSDADLRTFTRRLPALHVPHPIYRSIPIEPRNLYAASIRVELDAYLQHLHFPLAFEVEKAVFSGVLVPKDIVRDLKPELNKLNVEEPDNAGPIFNSFVLSLDYPGITAFPVARRPAQNRRRNKKKQTPGRTLGQRLADEAVAYISRLFQPRGRLSITRTTNTGIYQAYHLIITPTGRLLEGPLPDQSNSVLRRFGNHECFLRVTFQDETGSKPRRDPGLLIDELLSHHYKPTLVGGVTVGGRKYEFLGYSMSGLKEYAFAFVRPFNFDGSTWDATEIRDSLGDFSRIQRQPALLAARWSQAFSASDPSVVLQRESILFLKDRYAEDGSCFTDGVGTISLTLAREVYKALQRQRRWSVKKNRFVPPSAFQFRLGGSKGVLVVDPSLEGRVVGIRTSQRKFEGTGLSLDISTTSARPIAVFLNRAMIALLEHHRVSGAYIKQLQANAVDEVYTILHSLNSASAIFNQHGLGSSFRLPSLFNNIYSILDIDIEARRQRGLSHQLMITSLHFALTHILRDIKHRAHILVPGSFTLIGVSDEWDCLDEGEIYATVFDERTGLRTEITGDVLITRSPQIHPGDLQMVTAVRRPELDHLWNVVVFPCRGKRSLPSMLGGGDLDGDIYNLILDPNLHPPNGQTANPGAYKPLPRKETVHDCTVDDVADFVIDFIKTDLLGQICTLHLRIADLKEDGPSCEECIVLAEKASHAVDFPKTGTPVNLSELPRPTNPRKPDFLSGEGVNPTIGDNYYPSQKLLGELYRNVPKEEYHPNPQRMHETDGRRIMGAMRLLELERLGLPFIDDYLEEDLLNEMAEILEEYSTQLHHVARAHSNSKRASDYLSEAELVSGTIQARWTDPRRRREAVASMNLQTQELTAAIRRELRGVAPSKRTNDKSTTNGDGSDAEDDDEEEYEDFDDYDGFFYDQERHHQMFTRAYAAWMVAEDALSDDHSAFGASSFGLIALGMMLEIVKARRKAYGILYL